MSGPVKIAALGPARLSPRFCGCGASGLGPPALLPPAQSPFRTRDRHGACATTDLLRQGVRTLLLAAPSSALGRAIPPAFPERAHRCPAGRPEMRVAVDAVFCRSPRTRARFGGKTFPLSHLGGRAKSASPKHDAWELAAVKDRGCPPILRALRRAPCAPQNRLPPRPLLAAAWPWPRRPVTA